MRNLPHPTNYSDYFRQETCVRKRGGTIFSFRGHIVGADGELGYEHPQVDFGVALVESSLIYRDFANTPYFGQACQLAPQTSRICVVGTKRDAIRADYCAADLRARAHPSQAAYYHGCAYFSVNCHDGSGVEALCEHIGTFQPGARLDAS